MDFLTDAECLHDADDGHDYAQIVSTLKTMEDWDPTDRRPMIVIAKTTKGYWPRVVDGKIPGYGNQLISYQSHPYGDEGEPEVLCRTGAKPKSIMGAESSPGIRPGPVSAARERLIKVQNQYRRRDVAA